MVKMINAVLGVEMWVAEDRIEEYKAAGHKLAASKPIPADDKPAEQPKPKAKKESSKK